MLLPFRNHDVHMLNRYVQETTVAEGEDSVLAYIMYYIVTNECSAYTLTFLNEVLASRELLAKTVIVNDNKFYRTVINITPDAVTTKNSDNVTEVFEIYKKEADILFLYLVNRDWLSDVKDFNSKGVEGRVNAMLDTLSPYWSMMAAKRKESLWWKHKFMNIKPQIINYLLDVHNANRLLEGIFFNGKRYGDLYLNLAKAISLINYSKSEVKVNRAGPHKRENR